MNNTLWHGPNPITLDKCDTMHDPFFSRSPSLLSHYLFFSLYSLVLRRLDDQTFPPEPVILHVATPTMRQPYPAANSRTLNSSVILPDRGCISLRLELNGTRCLKYASLRVIQGDTCTSTYD